MRQSATSSYFLELAAEGGSNRASILNTVEDLAVFCDEKGASEEAHQLSILEILMINSGLFWQQDISQNPREESFSRDKKTSHNK
jgi:hypothetical protein